MIRLVTLAGDLILNGVVLVNKQLAREGAVVPIQSGGSIISG